MKNDKTALFETMPVGKALMTMAIPILLILNYFIRLYGVVSAQLLSDGITFIIATLIYRKVYRSLQQEALT